MMRSFKELFFVAHSLALAARTATANGAGVDLASYGAATVLVTVGAFTDGAHAITIEESDDNATFTAVAAADLDGVLPTINAGGTANQTYRIGYKGRRRFLRVVSTVTGGPATGSVYGGLILLMDPKKGPK